MSGTDERSGAARVRAKEAAASAYRAHLIEQRAADWRVALIDGHWRVAVRRPGSRWTEVAVDPKPGVSDRGDLIERRRMGAWVRDTVLEVGGIWLDLDYGAQARGRVAYTVVISR